MILTENEVRHTAENGIDPAEAETLFSYDFEEIKGHAVADRSGNNNPIELPAMVTPLKKQILSLPWQDFRTDRGMLLDVGVNLFGFVPLGFFLAAVLSRSTLLSGMRALVMTVVACCLVSLLIELAQAWLPSRNSSLLDLMLNTLGGGGGAMLALGIERRGWGKGNF